MVSHRSLLTGAAFARRIPLGYHDCAQQILLLTDQ